MNPRLKLKDFLPYRLSVLSNRISRDIARHYQERFNLSIPEWRVMAILGESKALSAGEVAELTAMDKVAVSRAVGKLLKNRFITRKKDVRDRRKTRLALTDRGRSIYDEIVPVAEAYERRLFQKLSDRDQKRLDELLKKLNTIQESIEN